MFNIIGRALMCATAVGLMAAATGAANAQSLREIIQIAVESNPQVGQAAQNREAVEFELKQALGLYAPRIDLEASVGAQLLSTPARRAVGIADDPLYPSQVGVSVSYDLLDGGFRQGQVDMQSARVDGASFRVLERSEFIALQVARLYYEIMLQRRIIDLSRQNVAFHQFTLDNVSSAVNSGQLTEADRLQAIERLAASRARVVEAQEQLENSRIELLKYAGIPVENPSMPARIGSSLPSSLNAAIESGRQSNPLVLLAGADVDAAAAQVTQAESALFPRLQLEGRASTGYDIGGGTGYTHDLQGRVVLRWNIYDGGINNAQVQESIRRESEALLGLHQAHREVEEAVRLSWERLHRQGEIARVYAEQLNASSGLVSSYQEQFNVGDRSLLDVLDAQNTRYNLQVIHETAIYSQRFAEYRLMAASGRLLDYLGIASPSQATAYARDHFAVPSYLDYEPRQLQQVNFGAPLNLTQFVD